jgi:endonuclease/exonuclease/phosphatase family metal-dependent hydrolase
MSQTSPKPLRFASFNIRAGLGTDLRRDADRVIAAIAAMDADVVALQEADYRFGARPPALPPAEIAARTGLRPLPVATNGISLGWHGNAILARADFALDDLRRLDLPGLEPRGAVIADLSGPAEIRVVAVHLGLLRTSRRRQLSAIGEEIARMPARPTVILGDFNEWSRRKGLGRLARDYSLLTPEDTYPAGRPRVPLDRIAHSPDLEARLLPVPGWARPFPSDHRPILAEVRPAAA